MPTDHAPAINATPERGDRAASRIPRRPPGTSVPETQRDDQQQRERERRPGTSTRASGPPSNADARGGTRQEAIVEPTLEIAGHPHPGRHSGEGAPWIVVIGMNQLSAVVGREPRQLDEARERTGERDRQEDRHDQRGEERRGHARDQHQAALAPAPRSLRLTTSASTRSSRRRQRQQRHASVRTAKNPAAIPSDMTHFVEIEAVDHLVPQALRSCATAD